MDESSAQIAKVFDSGDNIAVNASKVFHATLAPGTYVLVCNLPGHYKAGMHQSVDCAVTAAGRGRARIVEKMG